MSLTDLRPACRGLQPPNPNPNPNDGRLPHTLSQTFDLLAADFNHQFLLALLGGLALATVFLSRIEASKKLGAAWK
jgi:hypothetical protein